MFTKEQHVDIDIGPTLALTADTGDTCVTRLTCPEQLPTDEELRQYNKEHHYLSTCHIEMLQTPNSV